MGREGIFQPSKEGTIERKARANNAETEFGMGPDSGVDVVDLWVGLADIEELVELGRTLQVGSVWSTLIREGRRIKLIMQTL